ncbi:MAG: TIR domain-containing protein [Desulfococcaceae bacterium]|jgi:ActR/RegA family two-component response regulator|nr:TIR domain-containing protein [Desulfococcaceae bacterium]
MKVLAVEDGENWCRIFRNSFRKPQYELQITDDIDEAENAIKQEVKPDIAIVNLNLVKDIPSDESGKVILAHIQDYYPNLPRIVVSGQGGYSVKEITEQFIKELGVYDVIIKPFKVDDLIKIMNNAITENNKNQEITKPDHEVQVFISYAREDHKLAKRLYDDLNRYDDITPWLDSENLLPGQNWRTTIPKIIRESSYFLMIITKNSVSKRGYIQKEQKIALDLLDEFPSDQIFIIPARLDNTELIDEKLRNIQWADLSDYEKGFQQILRSIHNEPRTTS